MLRFNCANITFNTLVIGNFISIYKKCRFFIFFYFTLKNRHVHAFMIIVDLQFFALFTIQSQNDFRGQKNCHTPRYLIVRKKPK